MWHSYYNNNEMNKLILFFCLIFISCSSPQNKIPIFCNNELNLLGSIEQLPSVDSKISSLRDSLNSPLDSLFISEGYFVRFKITHSINDYDISLKMESSDFTKYPGVPPAFNPFSYTIHIYLQESDSILINRETHSIDSAISNVENWYGSLDSKKYAIANINLYWDDDSDYEILDTIVTKVVSGYLSFAEKISYQIFDASVCQLTSNELDSLLSYVPFRLRTDFYGSNRLNKFDFVPIEYLFDL